MKRACAWCEDEKPAADRARGDDVTHGICGRHAREVREEIAKMFPKGGDTMSFSVNIQCEYCHDATPTVRMRLLPDAERETVALCRECWQDVSSRYVKERQER